MIGLFTDSVPDRWEKRGSRSRTRPPGVPKSAWMADETIIDADLVLRLFLLRIPTADMHRPQPPKISSYFPYDV